MNIYTLKLGILETNCYIVETTLGQCVAFDIGGSANKFLNFIKSKNLKLTKIFLTHGHFDHIEGVLEVQEKTGAEVYIHEGDSVMLEGGSSSLAPFFERPTYKIMNYITVYDGDIICDGDIKFTVLHTAGHTKGSVCYMTENEIFTGDTLFAGSIGRTDYPSGDIDDMRNSLKRLKSLDKNYNIYSGHSDVTTLDHEKKNNPYMRNL